MTVPIAIATFTNVSPISYVHTYIECIHIHIIISPISYIHTYYIECIYILHIEIIHRDLKGHLIWLQHCMGAVTIMLDVH